MRLSRKGRQSAAWLCTITLAISSVFGNTVWAGQDEDWITKGSHSYHDCLIDEDCMEEMAVLFEDDDFLEENDWTEEEGQREMLKEMLRIYELFGKEPVEGWDYYADLADIELSGVEKATTSDAAEKATSSNADSTTNQSTDSTKQSAASKATSSDAQTATSSDLPSEFSALKKEVRGEKPKYQEFYCTELQGDAEVELLNLENSECDGTSASVYLSKEQLGLRPHLRINGEKDVYKSLFDGLCKNDDISLSVDFYDASDTVIGSCAINRAADQLLNQNNYNNYASENTPSGAEYAICTVELSEKITEKGFYLTEATLKEESDKTTSYMDCKISQNRNRHIKFVYPTATSFGGTSSDDGNDAVLTFKDFAVFANELGGGTDHIDGNVAVGKITSKKVIKIVSQMFKFDSESSRISYIGKGDASVEYTAGDQAEISLGTSHTVSHNGGGQWLVDNNVVGTDGNIKYIANADDTDNGGFSIDIPRALTTLSQYHPEENTSYTESWGTINVNCEKETTVVKIKAKDLEGWSFKLNNWDRDKFVIINVDTEGTDHVKIVTSITNTDSQVTDWEAFAQNIVWNFGDYTGVVENTNSMNHGLLLAPCAKVHINANWNGCIVADYVENNNNMEIHKVKPVIPDPDPDPEDTTESTTTTINESESKSISESISQSESESKSISESISQSESESKSVSESISQSESESKSVSESISQSESESKSVSESISQSESESKSKSESVSKSESESKSNAQNSSKNPNPSSDRSTTERTTTTTVSESSTETTSETTTTSRGTSTTTTSQTTTRGNRGGNGGGGNSGGGNGGSTPTVPIVDNPVPLANMPDQNSSNADPELFMIDDPDVPLGALPKTGDSSGTKLALFALSLSALMVQLRKRREEKEHES